MTPKGLSLLSAIRVAAIDRAAQQRAYRTAEDRSKRPVATPCHFTTSQCTNHAAYEQACGAIALAAIVVAVASAPDAGVAVHWLAIVAITLAITTVIVATVIVTALLIAAVAIAATVPATVVFE